MAYINRHGELKVRVRGVNSSIRMMAGTSDRMHEAARDGVVEAAGYLMDKIKRKFGVYQKTGGVGGGPWRKLNADYKFWKIKKGYDDGPLIMTGEMKDSFYVKEGGPGTIAASVASTDEKLPIHVFGSRDGHIPPRDPMLVTAVEEADECQAIIRDKVYGAWSNTTIGR